MAAMTNDSDELERSFRWMGHAFTVIAACMTASFGWSLGGDEFTAKVLIALGLALVTVLVAKLLSAIDIEWRAGNKKVAGWLLVAWCVGVGVEYFSHIGFTVGHRSSDVQKASLQTTVYTDTRGGLDEAKSRVAFFEKRLSELKGGEGWSSTRPVAAWQADIANLEGDFLYKRSKQCANVTQPDSRAFCDRLKELRANLATAEEHAKTTAMLVAARNGLDKARSAAVEVKKGDSAAFSQTEMVAQVATWSLAPSAAAMHWANISVGAIISLVFSFAATLCNFVSTRLRWLQNWGGRPGNRTQPQAPASPAPPAVLTAAPAPSPAPIHTREVVRVVERPAAGPKISPNVENLRRILGVGGHGVTA